MCPHTLNSHWVQLKKDADTQGKKTYVDTGCYFLIFKAVTNKLTATWMHHKHVTHMGEAHCCCVVVSCGVCACIWVCVCGMWIIREREREAAELRRTDTCIHVHTCTLPHTLFGGMINRGIFGSFRRGSENTFQLQKDFPFFILPVYSSGLIPAYCFFTIAVLASSSHHPRWRGSHRPHLDAVTNPTFQLIRRSRQTFSLVQTFVAAFFYSQGLNSCRWAACFLLRKTKTHRYLSVQRD